MKIGVIIFLILLISPLASAIDFNMKTNFSKGETLLATFQGNFQDKLSEDNILFYRGHTKVPMDFEFEKIENTYYVYASLLGKNSGAYSISLENAKYYKQGEIVDDPITKEFNILDNFSDFSIKPGFIVTDGDFSVEIQNLQDDNLFLKINKQTQSKFNNETNSSGGLLDFLLGDLFMALTGKISLNIDKEEEIEFYPGEIQKLDFSFENITQPTLKTINFNSANLEYNLPVYVDINISENVNSRKLRFEPSELKVSLEKNISSTEKIELRNIGNEVLENITFKFSSILDPYVNLSLEKIENLNANSSAEMELTFFAFNQSQVLVGELTAIIPNETEDLSITFEILPEELNQSDTNLPEAAKSKTCEELNGTICEENQKCSGEIRYAKDGNCCLEECSVVEENNTPIIIGWAIIMIIILALIWFFKFKYKSAEGEIDLFKIAKGK